jgi:hypothetical protein
MGCTGSGAGLPSSGLAPLIAPDSWLLGNPPENRNRIGPYANFWPEKQHSLEKTRGILYKIPYTGRDWAGLRTFFFLVKTCCSRVKTYGISNQL